MERSGMEAGSRLWCRYRLLLLVGLAVLWSQFPAFAASQRTQNFLISAPTPQLAAAVAEAAERYRRDLAIYWLGGPLAPWPTPCPIRVVAGDNLAAQGVTTYNPAPVRDFQMEVIGTPERILDSVLPHEVTHTILATYFGRPLPRWADEGICTTVEHESERGKHEIKLREFLHSRRGIAMNQLFLMTEYPPDVLPMYAQGYSVCRFLIDQKGARVFIEFLGEYMRHPSWTANIKRFYGYDSLKELQDHWLAWVSEGSGSVDKYVKQDPARSASSEVALAGASALSPQLISPVNGPSNASSANAPSNTALAASRSGQPNALNGPELSPASGQPAADGPATMLVSSSADGFYSRKRREAASSSQPADLVEPVRPMVPPSVRQSGPYQSAHPQAEQEMTRSGSPDTWAGATSTDEQFLR
jgi:hypothetical protein